MSSSQVLGHAPAFLSINFFNQAFGQSHHKTTEPLISQIDRLEPDLLIFKDFAKFHIICWCLFVTRHTSFWTLQVLQLFKNILEGYSFY